jgi:hypothetical protein
MFVFAGLMQIKNQIVDQSRIRLAFRKVIVPEFGRVLDIPGQRGLGLLVRGSSSTNRNGALPCGRTPSC